MAKYITTKYSRKEKVEPSLSENDLKSQSTYFYCNEHKTFLGYSGNRE